MDRISTKGEMVEQVDLRAVPHSGFDLSNHNFNTGKLGKIIPHRWDEVYPGDRIKGKDTIVANFEPLVSPIMGSLVMKQESFFIPYEQVWKNAHNFFTSKKGFDTPMPSVSPSDVYNAYKSFGLLSVLGDVTYLAQIADMLALRNGYDEATISDIVTLVNNTIRSYNTAITTFGTENYVLDLLQDFIEHSEKIADDFYQRFMQDEEIYDSQDVNVRRYIAQKLDDYHVYILNRWFGASSLFDYLSYPMFADYRVYYEYENRSGDTSWKLEDVVNNSSALVDFNPSFAFDTLQLSFLIFRAYYLVWYWNYRDQLLEKEAYDPEGDDFLADTVSDLQIVLISLLRVRCWYKDTFTTALDNTGDGNFGVPVSTANNDVTYSYIDDTGLLGNTKDAQEAFNSGATVVNIQIGDLTYSVPSNLLSGAGQSYSNNIVTENQYTIYLSLFDKIRRLENFTKRELIIGYEFDDVIWSNFKVSVSNVRCRIPELLSRGRDSVEINTIVNNTNTSEQIAGDKSAIAFGKSAASDVNYFAEVWGLYLSNYTIMPIQTYANGMPRTYFKRERFDFAWPEFATLGMDAVYVGEIATLGEVTSAEGTAVFGYQGRYYDLKTKQDEVHGRMRTDLNYLTFSRKFGLYDPLPVLNYIFVHCHPDTSMFVSADDNTEDIFRCDCYHGLAFERRFPVPSQYV